MITSLDFLLFKIYNNISLDFILLIFLPKSGVESPTLFDEFFSHIVLQYNVCNKAQRKRTTVGERGGELKEAKGMTVGPTYQVGGGGVS
jgi:hypothetical protein